MLDLEPLFGRVGKGETRSGVCYALDRVDAWIWICRVDSTASVLSVDILGQILGDLTDGYGQILLIVDLLFQLGQPSRICFFRYSNHNAIPCFQFAKAFS